MTSSGPPSSAGNGTADSSGDNGTAGNGTGADGNRPVARTGFDSPVLLDAPLPIFAVDLQGRVVLWNAAATELFGWPAEQVTGRYPTVIDRHDVETAVEYFRRVLAGETLIDEHVRLRRNDGSTFEALASASLLHAEDEPVAALVILRDISTEVADQRLRRAAEHKWRQLALRAVDRVSFTDADGHIIQTALEGVDTLGYPTEWWEGRSGFDVLHPEDLDLAATLWSELVSEPGARKRAICRARHAAGHYEQVEFTGVNLLDDPAVGTVVVASRNVSGRQQTERLAKDETEVLELVVRDAPLEAVWNRIITLIEYHTGGSVAAFVIDDATRPRLRLADAGALTPGLDAIARSDQLTIGEDTDIPLQSLREPTTVMDFATDERTRPWGPGIVESGFRAAWTQPVLDSRSGDVSGLLVTFVAEPREPTAFERQVVEMASHLASIAIERAGWQARLWRQAREDRLTQLPNRTAIFEHLDATLVEASLERTAVTVMVVDLDRFKLVNDSLGHPVGDRVLNAFADRLRAVVGARDFVGRMAADEFVIVFSPGVRLNEAKLAAMRLARALDEAFTIDDEQVYLTISAGLAMSTHGRETADTLLQRADTAMFRAKGLGRSRVEVYDERLKTRAVKRLEIDRELRAALERNELEIYYQPEIDCTTGAIVGAEALLRWHHPQRGLIQPDGFIAVAEESGIIVPIGHWVLDEAVRQARAWADSDPELGPFSISVNLSARQLINRSLVDTVSFILTRYQWPPSQLTLELTESILIEDRDATLYVLNRLRTLGVKLAIDDFGTGFASLDYLHRLHVDWIKIDKSFVDSLDETGGGSPVTSAMISMARAFELSVIAEGVEQQCQLDGLRALGCDVAQGYLIARPLAADELGELVRSRPTW